jgi:Mg2+-importing ATPase
MLIAVPTVVAIGAYLPYSPASHALGFQPLPASFFVALAAMVAAYLTFVEYGKRHFFERVTPPAHPPRTHAWRHQHVIRGRVARWTHHQPPQVWPLPRH